MKIKTIITETKEVDMDVQLPYYCCFQNLYFYKVFSEEKVIEAFSSEYIGSSVSVALVKHKINVISGAQQITEQEFNQAYGKALQAISEIEFQELIANDLYEHQS